MVVEALSPPTTSMWLLKIRKASSVAGASCWYFFHPLDKEYILPFKKKKKLQVVASFIAMSYAQNHEKEVSFVSAHVGHQVCLCSYSLPSLSFLCVNALTVVVMNACNVTNHQSRPLVYVQY